ncbi:hypothetical protein SOVF_065130 [Spinacia oleracea]|uniref:Glycine-rich cell wall structural protein 1.8-like n=1 Tax=Spinacia oleracea TaxID=3562 RepID=A0A9R0HTT8_SPIOL|nr:glycine-rich cell wall structural protein 1.8-like [Spinacia oleracea]KNA19054.1 hypothetical protein SOVF_065130 [Spinacia oleracea]
MSNRQTDRQTGTHEKGSGGGGGLGAPGSTGASGARDPLGAPGSTGASMTNKGAPGYDPTAYGLDTGGQQQQLHRVAGDEGAGKQHGTTTGGGQHRTDAGVGTGQGYTYGTAGSMGQTGTTTGYHAGVHVPHSTGSGGGEQKQQLHRTEHGGGDTGRAGLGGVGEGYDTGMGGGIGGGQREVRTDTVIIESVGVGGDIGNDTGEMDQWAARGVGGEGKGTHGGYDTRGQRRG